MWQLLKALCSEIQLLRTELLKTNHENALSERIPENKPGIALIDLQRSIKALTNIDMAYLTIKISECETIN